MKMQKTSLIAALAMGALLTCATVAQAQDTNAAPRRGGRMTLQQRVDRISTQLDLSSDQKTKVTAALEAEGKQMRELRNDSSLSRNDRREKVRALREDTNKKFKDILSSDQYEKWQKIRSQMARPRRNAAGGQGNGQ
ncbi:MAG TPA: hypothetical protein VG146_06665 [Verrucomicrobiae bacterium]|nr:hypothetical protein [Verrucomicrobiae bacterium]